MLFGVANNSWSLPGKKGGPLLAPNSGSRTCNNSIRCRVISGHVEITHETDAVDPQATFGTGPGWLEAQTFIGAAQVPA
jgi:hypothetical protein